MNPSDQTAGLAGREPAATGEQRLPALLGRWVALSLFAAAVAGVADAVHAWRELRALPARAHTANHPSGLSDLAWGAAGATIVYLPVAVAGGLVGILLARLAPGRSSPALERGWGMTAALGACLFLLAYHWTREWFFPGLPATDPKRLAVAAGLALGALLVGGVVGAAWSRSGSGLRRVETALALLVLVAGLSHVASESRRAATRGVLDESNSDLPNVVLFVIDALRADALACYGNGRVATPAIDSLADEGVLFENALTQAPYTLTSFASFFTGKYPRRHGLMKMAADAELEPNLTLAQFLKSARRTDGGSLHEDAYAGGAFLTGALSHGSGLAEGFDSYAEVMMGHPRVDLQSRWSIFRARLALPSLAFKLASKRNPDLLVDIAREWIREHAERRFFAFVHLYSTHTPYDPPEPFRSEYVDPGYDGPIQAFYADMRRMIERGDFVPDPADQAQVYDLYLGGVALADHHVGLVLADLEELGIADDTLVIVTSDHGEDFGEGGRWEHSHMYRSNLHVPLVMRLPGDLPAGRRVDAAVESVDLLPTVADLCDLTLPEPAGPRDVIDGVSLIPLVEGAVSDVKSFTYAEDSTYVSIADDRYMLVMERYAVRPDGWQIALEEGLGRIRFHDLERDPLQRNDLFRDIVRGEAESISPELRANVMAEVVRLRERLLAWNGDMPIDVEAPVLSDRDVENREVEALRNPDQQVLEGLLVELGYTLPGDGGGYGGELAERVLEHRAEREEPEDSTPR